MIVRTALLVVALAAVGPSVALASTSAASSASQRIGSAHAAGAAAIATASGSVAAPAQISLSVLASPAQRVMVSWDVICEAGTPNVASKRGQFISQSPIKRPLSLPTKHTGSCSVAVNAALLGSGSVAVVLEG